jgi:hypothetical protein
VTASVTGCSTWRRVFISMNQKPSGRRPPAPSAMNSTVPAPRIADGARGLDGGRAHGGAGLGGHARRGGLLDDLLVAALERAVALEEVDDIAVGVAEDLDLDMAGVGDELLDQDGGVAEGGSGLAAGRGEGGVEVAGVVDAAHALAAAAGDGLDEDGVADERGLVGEEGVVLVLAVVAGDDGDAGLLPSASWRRP